MGQKSFGCTGMCLWKDLKEPDCTWLSKNSTQKNKKIRVQQCLFRNIIDLTGESFSSHFSYFIVYFLYIV